MSDQGMRNLQELYRAKTRQRIDEIGRRFVRPDARPVTDLAVAETSEHLTVAQARRLRFRKVSGGFRWGKPWGTAWFRVRLRIPAAFKGETVTLRFATGGECIIFRNGQPVQALDHGRDEYVLSDRAAGGERIELLIEAGASGAFGDFEKRAVEQPTLNVFDRETWDAYWDLLALADLLEALPEASTRRARILFTLNRAVDVFDYGTPARDALRRQARKARRMLAPLYACRATDSAQTIACLGHAHIDVAWLWPLAETVRKCGRTFSNVLELVSRYPEFRFAQSQPQLYAYTRRRYPELYGRIGKCIAQGRWAPTGCMWVEADCNVTSGESLVRQILYGTRFFRREFGHDVVCLWLPDVFGYAASLPQILKRSGIDYFLTQKISWSQFTQFPYHSFWWEGIDGSRVLTHFPPVNTYNADLGAAQMIQAAANYKERDRSSIQAAPFGFGDGGGGPTAEMLERMRRYRDLEGMPRLEPMTPSDFFTRLARESADLPRWVGELYLEFHRGTYTTQAWNKKCNRQAENLLREAEMLCLLPPAAPAAYPQSKLNGAWETVLLNQFHDIIPGSSIDEVYRDSDRQYAQVLTSVERIAADAFGRLAKSVDARGPGTPVVAFNALSWERTAAVETPVPDLDPSGEYVAVSAGGQETPVQVRGDSVSFLGAVPAVGHALFHVVAGKRHGTQLRAGRDGLENERVRVEFDELGRVRRIRDKTAAREVLARGRFGNSFLLFEDKTATFGDAWDIDIFYNDKLIEEDGELVDIRVVESGPVRAVVRIRRRIGCSSISQDVVLTAGSSRVDFVTRVDWGDEKDVLLKVAFPVNVRSATARYEVQFGNVTRPTHWNRPQDFAMFEVPAQRWADLSEGDYGVALLNDCKYGHDIRDNVMRLTLLRAPKSPGKTADVGKRHLFTYALLPHTGDYRNGVVRSACELNTPLRAGVTRSTGGSLDSRAGCFTLSGDNVMIDTIKKAEDDDAILVRMYEAHGCRGRRVLRTTLPVRRVVECDLVEREERNVACRDGRMNLGFGPFQIRTLKLFL